MRTASLPANPTLMKSNVRGYAKLTVLFHDVDAISIGAGELAVEAAADAAPVGVGEVVVPAVVALELRLLQDPCPPTSASSKCQEKGRQLKGHRWRRPRAGGVAGAYQSRRWQRVTCAQSVASGRCKGLPSQCTQRDNGPLGVDDA